MAELINVHIAKTHLSQLLERVKHGEEFILAKAGKPYARLIPLEKPEKRKLGFMKGKVDEAFFAPLSDEELSAWE